MKSMIRVTFYSYLAVIAILSFVCLVLFANGCGSKVESISFNEEKDGTLIFSHQNISLKIFPSSKIRVSYVEENGKELSLILPNTESSVATHFLVVDSQLIDDFKILSESIRLKSIKEDFGVGKLLSFRAQAYGPRNSLIEKDLKISIFERYPDVAIVNATYKNIRSNNPITLDAIYNNAFQLDRRQLDREKDSRDFWGFFGYGKIVPGGHGHRRVNVLAIEADLDIQNDSELISGVPVVDVWAPEMGMAIASIEKRARIIKMPAKVDHDRYLNISLLERPETTLSPGESYAALQTAIIVHSLDYYHPLKRYADLMADQGITPKPCPEFGYDPLWCNWGYKRDWKLSHGLDRIDTFKALGIKTVTIDDGWFDNFGDWFVSETKIPRGKQELVEWVGQLHAEGLKVIIWWVPCIAGPATVEKHPDWVILDEDGNFVRSHWKNAYMLCPTLPEVLQYHRDLTREFITEYNFDGFKLDGIYVAPRCYNQAHNHKSPDESYEAYEDIFKAIYETVLELKPEGDFVLGQCPCGALASPYYLQWGNRPVTADPPLMTISTRHRVKAYKALLGPTSCVDNDFHERYNDYFPVEVGCGGLVTTKFTSLSDYEHDEFKKWYGLYNNYRLSSGEYLNLYGVGYEIPETYAIKKGECYYYTFLRPGINGPEDVPWFEHEIDQRTRKLKAFEEEIKNLPIWTGTVVLRGLEDRVYTVYDFETGEKRGKVRGPTATLEIAFRDHLIIRAVPE